MQRAQETVRAMLDDPYVLAIILYEIQQKTGSWQETGCSVMGYWEQTDPFLWTLVSLPGDLLGEVSVEGDGVFSGSVYAGAEEGAEWLRAGPFKSLDEAKAFVVDYLTKEGEVEEVFEECPWK